MNGVKQVPTGVKIISVLQFIGVGLVWISALMMLIGGIILLSSGPAALLNQGVPIQYLPFLSAGGVVFIVISVVFVGIGIFFFFVARGLWRLKNWARILTIVLQALSIIYYLYTIIIGAGGYFSLIVSAVIVAYLLFSKKVNEAFRK